MPTTPPTTPPTPTPTTTEAQGNSAGSPPVTNSQHDHPNFFWVGPVIGAVVVVVVVALFLILRLRVCRAKKDADKGKTSKL